MRVVIDTNCLLASIPPKGNHYWLYKSFENEAFEWVVSNEILTEYEEKIIERYSKKAADIVLALLTIAPNTTFSEPYYNWQLIESDADDNKFSDLAIATNVDYLVTNDSDFNILKNIDFPKVVVISLNEFQEIMKSIS